jgi:hypothetical protein
MTAIPATPLPTPIPAFCAVVNVGLGEGSTVYRPAKTMSVTELIGFVVEVGGPVGNSELGIDGGEGAIERGEAQASCKPSGAGSAVNPLLG